MKSQSRFPILSLVALLAAAPSLALPESLTYSAHVDSGDAPFDGSASMVFTLFDARDGGSALWTESAASVVVVSGELAHDLGSVTPLGPDLLNRDELYLEVAFNGTTLSPRVAFAAVPYALRARDAESAELCSLADDAEHAVNADHAAQADQATTATSATTAQNATQLGGRAAADYQFGVAASGGLALSGTSFSVASNGITRDHLRNGEVVLGKLGAGAVDASALASSAVTGAKIASGTISGDKIASGSISASHLSGGRIPLAVRPAACGGGLQTQNLTVTSGLRATGCTGGLSSGSPGSGLTWSCSSAQPCYCAQCETNLCGVWTIAAPGPTTLRYRQCSGSCTADAPVTCNASDFADTSVGYAVFE